ncbi:hypothetical protein [Nocardia sp. NBC_01329]|nr:hypothetical protein OG405_23905 [Nocardia sp. NBC_01329]
MNIHDIGAVVGAAFAAVLAVPDNPDLDFGTLLDETLDQLSAMRAPGGSR